MTKQGPSALRIIVLLTQMEGAGAQSAAMKLTRGLRERGHAVETWFFYRKRPSHEREPGIRVFLQQPLRGPLDFLALFRQLISAMRAYSPDAVVSFTHYANVIGQSAALAAGVPVRLASQRNPSYSYPTAARWADRLFGAVGLYSGNVAVSHSVLDSFGSYSRAYRSRMTVIQNGLSFVPSSLCQRDARLRFGLPQDVPLVVTCGRLTYQKNQAILVSAIAKAQGIHLAIAGEGELRGDLMLLARSVGASERMHLLGEIPHAEMAHLLAASDIYAMPSLFEGMSNALLEAMAAGLPVVVSNVPAQAEVLAEGQGDEPAGVLLPADDVDAWAQTLKRLVSDVNARATVAQRCKARASHFTIDRMVNAFEAALTA